MAIVQERNTMTTITTINQQCCDQDRIDLFCLKMVVSDFSGTFFHRIMLTWVFASRSIRIGEPILYPSE